MKWRLSLAAAFVLLGAASLARAQQMPNPKEMSGVPLPATDLPAGTVSVRVVRGAFAGNVTDQPVVFTIGGKPRTVKTDATGRAQVSGLSAGVRVQATTVVASEKLESKEFTIAASGIRIVLVAIDPEAVKREAEDKTLAAGPAAKGIVVMGPESRVVVELADEALRVYYVIEIVNSARTPVDIGGPFIVALPRDARGAALLEGSTPQAVAKDARILVTGPFAPGSTLVHVGYELPFDGSRVELTQAWPAALPGVTVLVPNPGAMDLTSPQITSKQTVTEQGQPLLIGSGPGLAAGQPLTVEISGLPHRARWPRYLALTLAGAIMTVGIWAAAFVTPRRRAA